VAAMKIETKIRRRKYDIGRNISKATGGREIEINMS